LVQEVLPKALRCQQPSPALQLGWVANLPIVVVPFSLKTAPLILAALLILIVSSSNLLLPPPALAAVVAAMRTELAATERSS